MLQQEWGLEEPRMHIQHCISHGVKVGDPVVHQFHAELVVTKDGTGLELLQK